MTEKYSPQKHEWGTDASDKYARDMTPGQSSDKKEKKKDVKEMISFLEHLDVQEANGPTFTFAVYDKSGKLTGATNDEKSASKMAREVRGKVKALDKPMIQTQIPKSMNEATYQGKDVPLNKPMKGDVKKSKVYVKDPKTGNVKKVNFGDKNMTIKKDQPGRKKSYCARSAGIEGGGKDKTKANYWSRKAWDC